MNFRTFCSLALVAALAATADPAPGAPLTDTQRTKVIAEVQAVTTAMKDACERLDADSAFKDFLIGPTMLAVASDGGIVDPDAYRDGMRAFYGSVERLHFATIREEFRVLAPDSVLYVWSYKVEGTSKKSGPWVIDPETASFVLRKLDGAWKFVFFHESAAPLKRPPALKAD
jgi:SnoaL-like domain